MPIEEMLRKSVTEEELGKVKQGVMQFVVPFFQVNQKLPLPPELPGYWSYQRDAILRNTIYKETMWAAAISIAITKVSSLSWELSGNVPGTKMKHFKELFLQADGKQIGWVSFLSKQLQDYLLTDNGCFIEIVRATKAFGSRIVGLRHLDSLRCQRTGDPDTPILYRSRTGKIHELKDYQVLLFSDMPNPSETYYGVGTSAASRAYPAIYKLAMIEKYLQEKVTGMRPLAIYIVNGLLDTQLKQAVKVATTEEQARGMLGYMGAVMIGVADDIQPQVATIPLAELPDRFARGEEFDISLYSYADNLGLDVQDLKPLGGMALGTGTQSQILHDKARGRGLVSWKQDFTHAIDTLVLPEAMRFAFVEKDYRDLQQKAQVSLTNAQVSAARVAAAITTAPQELQVLVDSGELPREFLEKDLTGNIVSGDTDAAPVTIQPKIWGLDENGKPFVNPPTPPSSEPLSLPNAAQPNAALPAPKVWGLDENGQPLNQPLQEEQVETPIVPQKIWGLDENGQPLEKKVEEEVLQEARPQKIWGLDENNELILHEEPKEPRSGKVWGLKELGVSEEAAQTLPPNVIEYAKALYRQVMSEQPASE